MEKCSERLQYLMKEKNLTQADILRKCHPYCQKYGISISKSALSQYCSGKYEPDQRRLTILSMALKINGAWLMGFDVPMGRSDKTEAPTQKSVLTEYEQDIVNLVKVIPEDKRKDFLNYLETAVKMMK